ncbi:MAG: GDP-mannose 4,6-dehydratase, partial [Candidatus Omnitrophota bacterium]
NVFILIRDFKAKAPYQLLGLERNTTRIQGDLLDYGLLARVLNEYSIDSCFHLAAQALVQVANAGPLSTFESNIKGTWNILEACRNSKAMERVVVASSDKAYGAQKKLPYTEESPLLGLYPYDASKACADILSRSYFISFGLPVALTRNANTYGGGDLNFSRIIPDAIRCLLEGKEFIIRSDGAPERDYMYVEDAAGAYITLAGEMHSKQVMGQAFNFGSGEPLSVIELFKVIARLCGKPKERPKILGTAKNEIDRQYLATDKARKILKWKAKFSLEDGLRRTIEWYRGYLKV